MRRLSSRAVLVVGAVVGVTALAWVYVTALQAPAAGTFHDDGVYIVTARALAEGQGYHIISLPEAPPQTKYPVLFPWLLSLVWRVVPSFPDNLPWLRAVPLASTVAWLWLSWHLLLRCGAGRRAATVIVALTAVSPWVVFLGTALMSETLFAALLTGALLAIVSARAEAAGHWRLCALAGLLAGASFLTRTAGVAVVAAGVGWLLMQRRWTSALAFGVAAATLIIPWVAWVVANSAVVADPYYSASNYGSWNIVFGYTWTEKAVVLVMNAVYAAVAPFSFWGLDPNAWYLLPSVVVAAFVIRGLWLTRTHPVTWGVVSYVGLVILWVWPPMRLLVPVAPLVAWQVSVAIRRAPVAAVAVVVAAFMTTSSLRILHMASHARAVGTVWLRPDTAEDWRRLSELYDWIQRETPTDAVLTGNLDPTYFLYTGRKAVRAFTAEPYLLYYPKFGSIPAALGTVDDFKRRLLAAGVDYCVLSPAAGFGETPYFRRVLDELSQEFPGSLTVVAGNVAAGYLVYRVDRARLTGVSLRPRS